MRPLSPLRSLARSLPLVATGVALACSDAATPPLAPTLPAGPNAVVVVATVSNLDDAGAGSLRQAIADAVDGTAIQFDASLAGKTIVLSTGALDIDKLLTIEGPVPGGLSISGGLSSGVISVGFDGNLTLRNLSIVDGRAYEGAGIRSDGKLTLDHSLVANNEVVNGGKPRGGGIYSTHNQAELTLVNTTVSGNYANTGGGIQTSGGPVTLRNSTIAANRAEFGGGIYGGGFFSIRNTIIADNFDAGNNVPPSANCNLFNAPAVFSGVNISSDASCGTDASLLIADPMLAGLVNNGGPTKTHALRAGSPAIDLGGQCTESTDQRYVARTQGTSCDVGAYEFDGYARLTLTAGPNAMVNSKTGVAIVSGTVACTAPGTVTLDVALSQTQKVTGRFTTIVQAAGQTSVNCSGTSSWSVELTPQTGKFENGSATATVQTTTIPAGFLSASVTAAIKLFSVSK